MKKSRFWNQTWSLGQFGKIEKSKPKYKKKFKNWCRIRSQNFIHSNQFFFIIVFFFIFILSEFRCLLRSSSASLSSGWVKNNQVSEPEPNFENVEPRCLWNFKILFIFNVWFLNTQSFKTICFFYSISAN